MKKKIATIMTTILAAALLCSGCGQKQEVLPVEEAATQTVAKTTEEKAEDETPAKEDEALIETATAVTPLFEDGTYVVRLSESDGLVLDVKGGSTEPGALLQVYGSNDSSAQHFILEYDAEKASYRIMNAGSGLYIVTDGTSVIQGPKEKEEAALWAIEEKDPGYIIRNDIGYLALDEKGSVTIKEEPSDAAIWIPEKVEGAPAVAEEDVVAESEESTPQPENEDDAEAPAENEAPVTASATTTAHKSDDKGSGTGNASQTPNNNQASTSTKKATPTPKPAAKKKATPTPKPTTTTKKATPTPKPSGHTHSWKTVNHPAEYKDVTVVVKEAWSEQVLVKDAYDEQVLVKEAWDEPIFVDALECNTCGYRGQGQQVVFHVLDEDHSGYHTVRYQDGSIHHDAEYKTVHHDAVYKTVNHPAQTKVEKQLVKAAWSETVCSSCGAKK